MIRINKSNIILETSIFLCVFFLIISTSFIYGSGSFSSDASTWIKQWLLIEEHNDNFPLMVKILFNFFTSFTGSLWHFNFLQNTILYFGSFFLVRECLLFGGCSKILSSLISLCFIFLFFMNPVILTHTSKWYIDYLFSGLLVLSLAVFINSIRYKSFLRFYVYIMLIIITISLKYNSPILLISIIFSYLLFLSLLQNFNFIKFIFGSVLIIFLFTLVALIPKLFISEIYSKYDLTVPYYEVLGIVHDNQVHSKAIFESLKYNGIDLTSGLKAYKKKNCAIPSLHSDSFKKNVMDNSDKFKEFYISEIFKMYPYELLKIKLKHFNFFLKNQNGCSFSNKLYSNYSDHAITNLYGKPWQVGSISVLNYMESKVELMKNSQLVQTFFIDLRGSIVLMIILIILFNLSSVERNTKKVITIISSFSFVLILGFFIANLGAFQKYSFPILLINYCSIYIMFWLLSLNLISKYRSVKSKDKIIN